MVNNLLHFLGERYQSASPGRPAANIVNLDEPMARAPRSPYNHGYQRLSGDFYLRLCGFPAQVS